MPFQLDNYDVSILKSLLKDGRKSFREVSRETGITAPTVKARFNRLVNVGFIKSVTPLLNFDMIEDDVVKPELQQSKGNSKGIDIKREIDKEEHYRQQHQQLEDARFKIRKGMKVKLDCEFCKGPIALDPYVFRFANYERFFCCTGCMSGYKSKYAGRIESIKRRFERKEY